ncbi:MAG: hypothetical protein VYC82_08690 [Verrucomicrobiota bacterium]|nr:hypothetical protein [Verrucomicrobiota bacterium]
MTNEPYQSKPGSSARQRKPWPMLPIVVAIIGFMAFYTWVQFSFRKIEPPYLPSEAMEDRTRAAELKNMYGWYSLPSDQVAGSLSNWDLTSVSLISRELPLEEALPSQVVYYLPRKPILVPDLTVVGTDAFYIASEPLNLALQLPSGYANHPDLYLTTLYKENQLLILPELRIEKESTSLTDEQRGDLKTIYVSIETGPLAAPSIDINLYNATSIFRWQIQAKSAQPTESE